MAQDCRQRFIRVERQDAAQAQAVGEVFGGKGVGQTQQIQLCHRKQVARDRIKQQKRQLTTSVSEGLSERQVV
jgi:hypothetical protein